MTLAAALPRAAAVSEKAQGLALYVHWPFCISKCPYCDFNSHVREAVDQDLWQRALLADLAFEARVTRGPLTSIFFGGGTPSLMPPTTVQAIIEAAAAQWGFAEGIEITLEANPSSTEAERFHDLSRAGVNRVSLGLQSLDPLQLRFLGRAHGVDEGLNALAIAQAAFGRVSFDLIYALPGQSQQQWKQELERALAFGTSHLSLYQLTIEPGTRFATLAAKGELVLPDSDEAADLFEMTADMTASAGLPRYEVSNHARQGQESRHNLAYWRYLPYVGVGPGAHGRRAGEATQRHRKPENWLKSITERGHGLSDADAVSPSDAALEALLMGLRLTEGVDLARLRALARPGREPVDQAKIKTLADKGLLVLEGDRLRVAAESMLLLEAILAEIAA